VQDTYNRPVTYLRLSLTDRCNFRCQYCMPAEGLQWLPPAQVLQDDEILALLRDAYIPLGIRRVRLTGGEPLLRRGLVDLVGRIAALPGIEDLSLSTNASLLAPLAAPLAAAGLKRVNISLDSLQPERFATITRGGDLSRVLAGIDACIDAGLTSIKLNAVIVPGTNDDEVLDLAAMTLSRPVHMRFIEMMPVGNQAFFDEKRYALTQRLMTEIEARYGLEETASGPLGNGPAVIRRLPGALGTVGFISPMSQTFCHDCNRTRLTADGQIKACLMRPQELDLLGALRRGEPAATLQGMIEASLGYKPLHHEWAAGQELTRTMSQIGG
jgi:cyclic pyranopterin phosphate synthase